MPLSIKCFFNSTEKINEIKLYRGVRLPEEVLQYLKDKKGKFIKFNEILSTTLDK